jgi:ketosteroid isomerase-like protein
MGSTRNVLENHLDSFREGNLKRILSDYAPSAVLFTPDGPLRGPEAIGTFFV